MNLREKNKTQGFTIIEVVLVLAIAGLIFLMVFIALPALQRNQRDTQRKSDLSRILTQVEQYKTNNRGQIPSNLIDDGNGSSFVKKYLGGSLNTANDKDYVDPTTGTGYVFEAVGVAEPSAIGRVAYAGGSICGVDGAFTSGTPRQLALSIKLENQTTPFCSDSR